MTKPDGQGSPAGAVNGATPPWYRLDAAEFAGVPYAAIRRLMHVSGAAVKVYLFLAKCADNATGVSWPSIRSIASGAGCCKRGRLGNAATVLRATSELLASGLIEVLPGRAVRGGNVKRYRNRSATEIEALPFCEESVTKIETKALPKSNPNETKERKSRNKTHRRALRFDGGDMATAEFIFDLVQNLDRNVRRPNFDAWAHEVRLMREQDKRTDEQIRATFQWANADSFWKSNILSPAKLREQFSQLTIKMQEPRNGHSGNGRRTLPVGPGQVFGFASLPETGGF